MLLGRIAINDNGFEPQKFRGRDCDGYSCAHAPDSHEQPKWGIRRQEGPPGSNGIHGMVGDKMGDVKNSNPVLFH
jgi:hypothetical protein